MEPYVIAADVSSVPPYNGRGGWTWYTGAAAWAWRLGVEAILGIRRIGDFVEIDPRIPRDWARCRAILRFPEGTLDVRIENPNRCWSGVGEILLDERRLSEKRVPIPSDGSDHTVIVRLGESPDSTSS